MSAGIASIYIEQGAVFSQEYAYRLIDGTTPIDITGGYIAMQMRVSYATESVSFEATTVNGKIVITDGPNGVFLLSMTPLETSALVGSGVYDIEYSSGGDITTTVRLVQGTYTVSLEATKV